MSRKNKFIFMLSSTIVSLVVSFIAIYFIFFNKQMPQTDELTPIYILDDATDPQELGVAHNTISEADDSIETAPDRVVIMGYDYLYDNGLSEYAATYLPAYMTTYLNYYVEGDDKYIAVVGEYEYEKNVNYDIFYVFIEDLDLKIRCVWMPTEKRYKFTSSLNPER